MNDFVKLLQLLWKLVRLILEVTSYVACTALLLVACAPPWRLVAIIISHDGHSDGFRIFCLVNFVATIFDMICMPLGLASLLLPTRSYAYVQSTVASVRTHGTFKDFDWALRCVWVQLFFEGLLDIPCLVICLPGLLVPTRLYAVVALTWKHRWKLSWRPPDSDNDISLRLLWVSAPILGLIEVFAALAGALAMVTLVRSCQTVKDAQLALQPKSGHDWFWDGFYLKPGLLLALLANGASVVVDIVFLPLLLVLGLTGWRLPVLLGELRHGFDWKVRYLILEQFVLLLLDIVVLPLALIVLLTHYRSGPVVEALGIFSSKTGRTTEGASAATPAADTWQLTTDPFKYHLVVLRAGGLIFLDVLALPALLVMALCGGGRLRLVGWGKHGTEFHESLLDQFAETLIDVPFMLAGLVVVATLYRADLVIKRCVLARATAWRRRREAAAQFLSIFRDILLIPATAIIIATFYRLPALLAGLLTRSSPLVHGEPSLRPLDILLVAPTPSGRPGLRVRVMKPPNLARVTEMRLQVAGEAFWQEVARTQGQLVAAAARAMLPVRLRDGIEVNCAELNNGRNEASLSIDLNVTVERSTLQGFLRDLARPTELLVQLEGKLSTGERVVLISVAINIAQLALAFVSREGALPVVALLPIEAERLAQLQGSSASLGLRDGWWMPIAKECAEVVVDFLHVLLGLALLVVPWRLVSAMSQMVLPSARRTAGQAMRALAALRSWETACSRTAKKAEPLLNTFVKVMSERVGQPKAAWRQTEETFEQHMECFIAVACCLFCPCCPNYNFVEADDLPYTREERVARSREVDPREKLQHQLAGLGKSMAAATANVRAVRWKLLQGPRLGPLGESFDARWAAWASTFFWPMLLAELSLLLVARRLSPDEHASVSESVRARAVLMASRHAEQKDRLEAQFRRLEAEARAVRGCDLKSRALCREVVREQAIRGVADVLSVLAALVLVLTVYRVPRVLELAEWSDVAQVQAVVKSELRELAQDALVLLQTLLLAAVLAVTVVRLPGFVAGIRPSRGLRFHRDWALWQLRELLVGLAELLLLLTAWKTYRLATTAAVFLALSPAAMLATATPALAAYRQGCFRASAAAWAGLLAATGLAPGLWTEAAAAGLLCLAFVGFCLRGAPGWACRRGGSDWWSPAVRLSTPNLFALLTVASEAFVLAALGRTEGATSLGRVDLLEVWNPTVIAALTALGAAALVATVPAVACEEEQAEIVAASSWRWATQLLQETLFPLLLVVLAPLAIDHWPIALALLYFVFTSLLTEAAWDVAVPRTQMLDIRHVGLNSSGRRLLLTAAVFATFHGSRAAFVGLTGAFGLWTVLWSWHGSSVLWVDVLRLGAAAGGVVGAFLMPEAVLMAWGATAALALTVAVASAMSRRCRPEACQLAESMQHLGRIQARLSLWGDPERTSSFRFAGCPHDAAIQLVELEERLPFDRLTAAFLQHRAQWRRQALAAEDYPAVLQVLAGLEKAIEVPHTRALLHRLMRGVPLRGSPGRFLPRDVVVDIVSFVVREEEQVQSATEVPSPLVSAAWAAAHLDLEGALHAAQNSAASLASRLRG